MKNRFHVYGVLLFLVALSGCSKQPRFENTDVIVARHADKSAVIVEYPQRGGPFVERGAVVGHIGQPCGGAFDFKGKKRSFNYPNAVEGMFYVVTPLTDKDGEISLLVTLYPK